MKRVLVTGGAGFIGSHLADALHGLGADVIVLDNLSSGLEGNLASRAAAELIKADVSDIRAVHRQIGRVDVIFHLAALISGFDSLHEPEPYLKSNVDGTLKVIQYMRDYAVPRIVFASSSTIYGHRTDPLCREDDVPAPKTVYALSKIASEHLLAMYAPLAGYTHTSLRLFNVYGPRQSVDHAYANVTCKFAHAAAKQQPVVLFGDGSQSRDFIYIDDVIAAFLLVAEQARHPVYNVGTGRDTTIRALLETVESIAETRLPRREQAAWPNDIQAIKADIGRIGSEFGFRPKTDLRSGLAATIRSFADR